MNRSKEPEGEEIRLALIAGDMDRICGMIRERFSIPDEAIPSADIRGKAMELREIRTPNYWSGSSWKTWLKIRLIDRGIFLPGSTYPAPNESTVSGIFHIGFLSVEETQEHLDRLQRGQVMSDPARSPVARSKVFSDIHHVFAVDRVAARVAPGGPDL